MKEEFKILSATAILGYGFPIESFERGMAKKPDLIAVDAGSTDPGPYYLGAGVSFTDRNAVKRDLEIMIKAGLSNKIPVVVGTAGGSGANPHLNWCVEIVEEILSESSLSCRLAIIESELSHDRVKKALREGKIQPLQYVPELTETIIDETTHIVAQMGTEPFIEAHKMGADIIIAGRAYDPAVFAALPIMRGCDEALSLHIGKILECAAICCTPGSGSDCMFGRIGEDYFILEPLSDIRKCTTLSVSAHTLYEKTNPYILPGPGGHLDLHDCSFTQHSENSVKVMGTKFIPEKRATVKLEGARLIGYRTVSIAGTRDEIMISNMDEIENAVKKRVEDNFKDKGFEYNLRFIVYGRDGVMGENEPLKQTAHELGIIIEATAKTQEQADTICAFARSTMLHYGYTGRKSTAGNLAFPYSPSDLHAGEVFAFSIYHLMQISDDENLFPVKILEIGG
ncbi:DUF1446 domain-containing protein [Clostridiaceae bacterium OttesenSCG-928-D20]|nr:DUF1446 domain-containing protein [Clostridiaceae bacterium OttesenSCG-928-D20]